MKKLAYQLSKTHLYKTVKHYRLDDSILLPTLTETMSNEEQDTLMKGLGVHDWETLRKVIDHDGDGEISFHELNSFLTLISPGRTVSLVFLGFIDQVFVLLITSCKSTLLTLRLIKPKTALVVQRHAAHPRHAAPHQRHVHPVCHVFNPSHRGAGLGPLPCDAAKES